MNDSDDTRARIDREIATFLHARPNTIRIELENELVEKTGMSYAEARIELARFSPAKVREVLGLNDRRVTMRDSAFARVLARRANRQAPAPGSFLASTLAETDAARAAAGLTPMSDRSPTDEETGGTE